MFIRHLAIIMDGNLRWADKHSIPFIEAYKKGVERALELLDFCISANIQYLTLYAFSTENWQRPQVIVEELLQLFSTALCANTPYLIEKGISVKFIGELDLLPLSILKSIELVEESSANNTKLHLTVALSYGARQEILHAIKKISSLRLRPEAINSALLQSLLYTHSLPDPDLLIRTSGEKRLSNFLLWQMAYTELYFSNTLWPDFTVADLKLAIQDFYTRNRKYGV